VEQVSFQASDLTGIAKAAVVVDGHVMTTQQGVCDYTQPLPCKPLSPVLEVDTTQLADGNHTVALIAYDAAGNQTQVTEQIVVANQAPSAPVGLKAVAQADGSFAVSWSDPSHVAPITGATYQLCSPGGGCGSAMPVGHDSPLALPASAAGQTTRVWLTDAAGNSSSANAASVALVAPAGTGPPPGTPHEPALRVKHALHGHRLIVTALVPAGIAGPVQFSVQAMKGKRRVLRTSKRAKVKHGRAVVVFVLSRATLSAGRLSIDARAKGATSATAEVSLGRGSRPRTVR
jgi:hypothetical protein